MKLIVKSDLGIEVEVDVDLSRVNASLLIFRVTQAVSEAEYQDFLIRNMTPEEIMENAG